MRRMPLLCALCVSVMAAAALAATALAGAGAGTGLLLAQARPAPKHGKAATHRTKKSGRQHGTRASRSSGVTAASADDPVLFGDQTIESNRDWNRAGSPEAFRFQDATSGSASSITVYIDSKNRATTLIAGVFSDNNGQPASLLTSGSLRSPKAGSWNQVPVTSADVQGGSNYWIAVLGVGGTLYFRDRNNGPCSSQNSSQTTASSLASSWSAGPSWPTCPISAYVSGTTATPPVPSPPPPPPPPPPVVLPPANALPPSISGTLVDGQVLTASNGTWLNDPASYGYQWQGCDNSAANCGNIAGATGSSYTLADADIGHTIRVVVTGSNSAGSASATSSQTGSVAPPPAPGNSTLPSVSGSTVQGQTLSTTNGSWTSGPTSYSYAWQDCNSSGGACSAINGAAANTYALKSTDVGHTIRAVVTAKNAGGSGSATSAPTAAVTPPPAPTNTAVPQISGSTVQGSKLTATTGSWTGSPTSYGYAWEDCGSSGAGCGNISGAGSNSYTLQSSDAGHTIRVTVTATNSGGSGHATSASVGPVTAQSGGGGGGTSPNPGNGLSTDPSFFPIGVWDQTPSVNASNYAAIGVNTFVGQYDGNDSADLQAAKNAGMYVISQQDSTGLSDANNSAIKAWQSLPDEPDAAQPDGSGGYGPCVSPSETVSTYNHTKAADPTRPVYLNLSRGVADTGWVGRGSCTGQTSLYPQYAQGADIVSFDVYPVNDGLPLSILGIGVDNLRQWAGAKPLYAFVETTPYSSGNSAPTPAQVKAETWLELIHGANGIEYFCHILSPSFSEAGCLTLSAIKAQMQADDAQIKSLAPVLNSPVLTSGTATVSAGFRVDSLTRTYGGSTFLFAEAVDANGGSATFTVPTLSSGTVTVLAENRTLSLANGQFTDAFSGYGVHLYQITGGGSPPPNPVPPTNTSKPTISGTPQQGDTLTASNGTWSGDTPMTYSCAWSDGTQGCSDTLPASDVSQNVSVTVTATNDGGSATATSASAGPVTAASGSGGSGGGCPAYPAFPDASCTGWRHTGVTLQKVGSSSSGSGWYVSNGTFYVTKAGTVIDSLDIPYCVNVFANNVTIQRSYIHCNGYYLVKTYDGQTYYTGLNVTDTEIDGENNANNEPIAIMGTTNAHYLRLNIHGLASSGPRLESGDVMEDSYIHDFVPFSGCHEAGSSANDGGDNITVEHNNIDVNTTQCGGFALEIADDFGYYTNVLIENNLFNTGGPYCTQAGVNVPQNQYSNRSTYIQYIDNVFGREYNAECGQYGPESEWGNTTGDVWAGNTWGGGAAAGSDHKVGDPVNP